MSERVVEPIRLDLLGDRCPIPVQKIRKAIKNNENHSKLIAIGDDPESQHDIPALLSRLGLKPPEIVEFDSGWKYTIDLCSAPIDIADQRRD